MFIDAGTKLCANANKMDTNGAAQHEETQINLHRTSPPKVQTD